MTTMPRRRLRTTAVLLALAGAALPAPAVAATTTTATQPPVTLSSPVGPYGGGNEILVTSATNRFYAGKVAVQFQLTTSLTGTSCTTNYDATSTSLAATSTTYVTAKKISVVAPSLGTSNGTYLYLLCVYNGTATSTATVPSKLLGRAGYTAAGAPAITDQSLVQVPTFGGTTISVSGSNFATGLTATLGGTPLTDVVVWDSSWFTATAPPHQAGYATLSITSVGGTVSHISSANNGWQFVDAVGVSPSAAPAVSASAPVTIDLLGSGFAGTTWGTTDGTAPDSTGAHVYLLRALSASSSGGAGAVPVYNPASFAAGADKTTPEISECTNPVLVSDSELTCVLDLAYSRPAGNSASSNALTTAAHVAAGVYALAVVTNGASTSGTVTGQASAGGAITPKGSSTFVVAPF